MTSCLTGSPVLSALRRPPPPPSVEPLSVDDSGGLWMPPAAVDGISQPDNGWPWLPEKVEPSPSTGEKAPCGAVGVVDG